MASQNTDSAAWRHAPKSEETRAKMSAAMRGNTNRVGKIKENKKKMVSLRLAPEILEKLESLVASGAFPNKAVAIETAIRRL